MSSLFSDPPFSRGTTLLNGEEIEFSEGTAYSNRKPAAGVEIVGQVKAFLDFHPVARATLSNELVYCIAARFKPASESTVLNPNNDGSARGRAVVLRMSSSETNLLSTAEFTDTLATGTDAAAGERIGFIDEYLSSEIRANDIVWVVFRGPCNVAKKAGGAVNAGAPIRLDVGNGTAGVVIPAASIVPVATLNSESVVVGQAIGTLSATTGDQTLGANAAIADTSVRALLNGVNWA